MKAVSQSPAEALAGCPNKNRNNKKIESARGRWDLPSSHRAPRNFFYFRHSLVTTLRESPRTGIYIHPDEKTAPNKHCKQQQQQTKQQQTRDLETFENIPSTAEEKANALKRVYAENLDIQKK